MQYHLVVSQQHDGERVDKVVVTANSTWTRAKVQDWIRQGFIQVDGNKVKANYRVKQGQTIDIQPPQIVESAIVAEEIPLDIRFEDADLLVVNKPRGLVVHPAPGHPRGTLVNALLYYCQAELSGIGGVSRPGIVHRIDKDTSGLLIVAKNDFAHQALAAQLKEHQIDRIYTTVVEGVIPHQSGTVDAPIGRDPVHRKRMKVDVEKGKPAVTHFSVNKRLPQHTWIDCQLETGRTHQIRVHMNYIGYPIVGDPLYGHKRSQHLIQGQALHAKQLRFLHPRTKKWVEVQAEMPKDMQRLLERLR